MTAGDAASTCPLPPADFASRTLPVREFDCSSTPLLRIHLRANHPVFHSRRSSCREANRFDAPADEFGVLYASASFSACMAEAIVRDRYAGGPAPLVLEEFRLRLRSLSRLEPHQPRLRLADFSAPLVGLGFSTQVLATPDYAAPNQWSLAVHRHPEQVDGIYFVSRYANEASVALFDRVPVSARGAPVPLLECAQLEGFLQQHEIALVP
ncbi:MAG TPA: RES domain-containing protein [Telluria sp.]